MPFVFLADLGRDEIGLAYESAERFRGFLPLIHPADLSLIRDRHDDLDGHIAKTTLIRSCDEFGKRPQPRVHLPEQILSMSLEIGSQELALTACLLDRGWKPLLLPAKPTRPLVASSPIVTHTHFVRHRLTLHDDCAAPVKDEVVDLTDAWTPIVLRLMPINEA
tara:strand:+ start:684 stop:1175 length:492 start_codon:yes stop_codon:yes gene_type:complete